MLKIWRVALLGGTNTEIDKMESNTTDAIISKIDLLLSNDSVLCEVALQELVSEMYSVQNF
jgi:hypothetical protein